MFGGAAFAAPDWSKVPQRKMTLFYPGPVSYTHLDVYKRQEITLQWIACSPSLTGFLADECSKLWVWSFLA